VRRETFRECIDKGHLLETRDQDTFLAEELLKLAEHREQFWKNVLPHAEEYPTLFIEGHYEILKELCTAILVLDGWRALNHECLFTYLKEKRKDLEIDHGYMVELKDIRNAMDYRGVKVSPSLWKDNQLKLHLTINALKEYIKEKLGK